MSALAEALAPLYRGYLRRLEEMAARIGARNVLREPVARDDEQGLVRNASGSVLRFDLADSSTGETFEVHGARPDDPGERQLRVGPLAFHLESGNWEELPVRCSFGDAAPRDDAEALAELLRGWAVLAAHGGFASARETNPELWSGRLHSASVRIEGAEVVSLLDLGTCPPAAFDPIAEALAAFGRERVPLTAVQIGGRP